MPRALIARSRTGWEGPPARSLRCGGEDKPHGDKDRADRLGAQYWCASVVPAKRDRVTRLSTLLRVPFPGNPNMAYG